MTVSVSCALGSVVVEGDEVVCRRSGTRGIFFKKEPWSTEERYPVAKISDLDLREERGRIALCLKLGGPNYVAAFQDCQPPEALEDLLEQVLDANQAIRVNSVDVGAQTARLREDWKERQKAEEAYQNEIVGVDRRVTFTRVALGGVIGGLLFKKKHLIRRRDS